MKLFQVYLYRSADCKRGWLAYLGKGGYPERATALVELRAETGAKAKNAAVTQANQNFQGLNIIRINHDDELWGIKKFPELTHLTTSPPLAINQLPEDPLEIPEATNIGQACLDAVRCTGAIETVIEERDRRIFVWKDNAQEQIEAWFAHHGWPTTKTQ